MRDLGLGLLLITVGIPWALTAKPPASAGSGAYDFPLVLSWLGLPTGLMHYGAFRIIDGLIALKTSKTS